MQKAEEISYGPGTLRTPLASPRFWLRSEPRGTEIPLPTGIMVVGRSPTCEIVVDEPEVSRQHARLTVSDEAVLAEDLGSANGVFVNGQRVTRPRILRVRDQLAVGSSSFVLRDATDPVSGLTSAERTTARREAHSSTKRATPSSRPEMTRREDAFELLRTLAERLISAGKTREAEAALEPFLTTTLSEARSQSVIPATRDDAVYAAMKLARATGKAEWVEYVFELCTAANWLLPLETVDELYEVVRKVPPVRVRLLREYLERLREAAGARSAADQFVLRRLDGLETLLAAR